MIKTISIDIGYGHVKAVSDTNKSIIFPSVVETVDGISETVIGTMDDYCVHYIDVQDKAFGLNLTAYVGDAGLVNNGVRRWEDKDRLDVDSIKLLTATAVAALVDEEEIVVNLLLGLPVSFYQNSECRDQLIQIFADLNAQITINGTVKTLRFNTVQIYAQSAGAYYAAICDTDGSIKDKQLVTLPIGIIDIGFRTVDIMYIGIGAKGPVSLSKYSGSLEESGMNRALQLAAEMASQEYKRTIRPETIEKALLVKGYGGKIPGTDRNVTPIWSRACKKLAQSIISDIKRMWSDAINDLTVIKVTGGGGKDLYEYIKAEIANVTLQDDPIYANANGYHAAAAIKRKAKTA